jgi:hypothetical protein
MSAMFYCSCCGSHFDVEYDVCPSCGTEGEWMTEDEFFDDKETNSMTSDSNQLKPAPSGAKFIITASIDGFPIQIEFEGGADSLRSLVSRLKAIGAEPPQVAPVQKAEPEKKAAPLCPDHGTPMKASRKPGSYFCPRQAEDGSGYCPHKA